MRALLALTLLLSVNAAARADEPPPVQAARAALATLAKQLTPSPKVKPGPREKVNFVVTNKTGGRLDPEAVKALAKELLEPARLELGDASATRTLEVVIQGMKAQRGSDDPKPRKLEWFAVSAELRDAAGAIGGAAVADVVVGDFAVLAAGSPELASAEEGIEALAVVGPKQLRAARVLLEKELAKLGEIEGKKPLVRVLSVVSSVSERVQPGVLEPALRAALAASGRLAPLADGARPKEPVWELELGIHPARRKDFEWTRKLSVALDKPGVAKAVASIAIDLPRGDAADEEPAPDRPPPAVVDCRVVEVKDGRARLSAGTDDRVQSGMMMKVTRGGTLVATGVVRSLLKDSCHARILSVEKGQSVEPGDSVEITPAK